MALERRRRRRIILLANLIAACFGSANIERNLLVKPLSAIPQYSFSGGVFRQLLPTKNISFLLDDLLKDYDRKLRPRFGGPPTIVEIDVEVRSMGQISEMDMTFSMDCYFRQSWVDERLAFSASEEAFTLSLSVLDRLWKPDTFIYNGKNSYAHLITTPNRFVRLHHTGKILYSSRLTIQARCPMNLEDFPMDTQRCPLELGSFGYTTRDVLYRWNEKRQLVIAADMKLSQFDMIAAPSAFVNVTRHAGVTTVLTMTFLGLEARKDLPKVSYSTALDLFVWISFGFIFATIIEFAFVHSFTKFGSGEELLSDLESDCEEDDEDEGEEWSDDDIDDESESKYDRQFVQEEEYEAIKRLEESIEVQILKNRPCDHKTCSVAKCAYYEGALKQQATRCQSMGENEQLKDVILHSSLPRSIERNLNLSFPPPPPLYYRPSGSKRSNKVMAAPMQKHSLITCQKDDSFREEIMDTKVPLHLDNLKLGQQKKELCPACHIERLKKYSRLARGSDAMKARRRKFKKRSSFRPFLFESWCKGRRCYFSKSRRRVKEARAEEAKRRTPKEDQPMNSVSNIDEASRILFPLSFLLINLIYWYSYLSHSQRLLFNLNKPNSAPTQL